MASLLFYVNDDIATDGQVKRIWRAIYTPLALLIGIILSPIIIFLVFLWYLDYMGKLEEDEGKVMIMMEGVEL